MSAFVIDTATMDRCVKTICGKGRYGAIVSRFGNIDTSRPEAPDWIGRLLFTLNIEAVQQRYPDTIDRPDDMPGTDGCAALPRTYKGPRIQTTRLMRPALCDGYKALTCLRYQCSEGDVPETAALYRELCEAIAIVANEIVCGLPEYEVAAWG